MRASAGAGSVRSHRACSDTTGKSEWLLSRCVFTKSAALMNRESKDF